jgi:hypothetical protein
MCSNDALLVGELLPLALFIGVIIMKKFIKGVALFAAIFAFGAAANAQINYRAEVNVPFGFTAGDKTYEAGKYTIAINKQMVAGAVLTIQKEGSDELGTFLVSNNRGQRSEDVQLVFGSVDGRKVLTNITSANSDYALLANPLQNRKVARVKIKAERTTGGL